MNNLGAYNNDPELKGFLLAEDKLHVDFAAIPNLEDHQALADYINIPVFLIHMRDWIFENCEDHEKWSGLFFSSIEVGADLSTVEKRWKEKLKEFDAKAKAYVYAADYVYLYVYPDAYAAYPEAEAYARARANTYADAYARARSYPDPDAKADVKAKMKEFFIGAIKESPEVQPANLIDCDGGEV